MDAVMGLGIPSGALGDQGSRRIERCKYALRAASSATLGIAKHLSSQMAGGAHFEI
jgi:hypothetical protein